jgi:hypothetical protein
MEEEIIEQIKTPINWQKVWTTTGLMLVLLCVMGIGIALFVQKDNILKAKQQEVDQLKNCNVNLLNYKDSLTKENARMTTYKTLCISMAVRDEAVKNLKYKPGDIVRMKIDSSKAVIQDYILGGSKFSYFIMYRITNSDGHFQDVAPQLIY